MCPPAKPKHHREPPVPEGVEPLLGVVPDLRLARRLKVSAMLIALWRRTRGIPATRTLPRRVIWTPTALRLLGRVPDTHIAKRMGISDTTVRHKALELGKRYQSPRMAKLARSRRFRALLGTRSDGDLAQLFTTTIRVVRALRKRFGILPFQSALHIRWTPRKIAALGVLDDRIFARTFGISRGVILHKRRELGIPARRWTQLGVRWSSRTNAWFRRMTDREIARRLDTKVAVVERRRRELGIQRERPSRWTPALDRRLGKITDTALARELGVATQTVTNRRTALGIPAHCHGAPKLTVWTPRTRAWLGVVPDRDIAKRLGIGTSSVVRERLQWGIPGAMRPGRFRPADLSTKRF